MGKLEELEKRFFNNLDILTTVILEKLKKNQEISAFDGFLKNLDIIKKLLKLKTEDLEKYNRICANTDPLIYFENQCNKIYIASTKMNCFNFLSKLKTLNNDPLIISLKITF